MRRRLPTSISRPRREWWSFACVRRCSVSSLIRSVSSATCTSAEPVSPLGAAVLADQLGSFSPWSGPFRENAVHPAGHGPLDASTGRTRLRPLLLLLRLGRLELDVHLRARQLHLAPACGFCLATLPAPFSLAEPAAGLGESLLPRPCGSCLSASGRRSLRTRSGHCAVPRWSRRGW